MRLADPTFITERTSGGVRNTLSSGGATGAKHLYGAYDKHVGLRNHIFLHSRNLLLFHKLTLQVIHLVAAKNDYLIAAEDLLHLICRLLYLQVGSSLVDADSDAGGRAG